MKNLINMTLFFLVLILFSCASHSRPTLYPNEVLKERGNEKAQVDIDQCLKEADEYFKTPEGKKIAKGGSYGTSVGTSVGIGIGGGVGVGVGVGASEPRMSSTDVKRGYVNQCLANKGYQVLAWD